MEEQLEVPLQAGSCEWQNAGRGSLRGDWQAAVVAARGFWLFVRSCRPLRYQAVLAGVLAVGGYWRDFGVRSWIVFALIVGLGVVSEAINTTLEETGTKLAKNAWMLDCLVRGEAHRLVVSAGVNLAVIPDEAQRQNRDDGVGRIKDLAAGIVFVVFLLDITLYTIIMIWPR